MISLDVGPESTICKNVMVSGSIFFARNFVYPMSTSSILDRSKHTSQCFEFCIVVLLIFFLFFDGVCDNIPVGFALFFSVFIYKVTIFFTEPLLQTVTHYE